PAVLVVAVAAVEERCRQVEEVSDGLAGCGEPGGPGDHADAVGGAVQRRARIVTDGFADRGLNLGTSRVPLRHAGGLRWGGHINEEYHQRELVARVALEETGPLGDLATERLPDRGSCFDRDHQPVATDDDRKRVV